LLYLLPIRAQVDFYMANISIIIADAEEGL